MVLLFVVVDDDGWLKEERRTTRRTFRRAATSTQRRTECQSREEHSRFTQGKQERSHIFLKPHKTIRHAEANHKHER